MSYLAAQLTVDMKIVGVYDDSNDLTGYRIILAASSAQSMFNFGLEIGNLDIGLGAGNIFTN